MAVVEAAASEDGETQGKDEPPEKPAGGDSNSLWCWIGGMVGVALGIGHVAYFGYTLWASAGVVAAALFGLYVLVFGPIGWMMQSQKDKTP